MYINCSKYRGLTTFLCKNKTSFSSFSTAHEEGKEKSELWKNISIGIHKKRRWLWGHNCTGLRVARSPEVTSASPRLFWPNPARSRIARGGSLRGGSLCGPSCEKQKKTFKHPDFPTLSSVASSDIPECRFLFNFIPAFPRNQLFRTKLIFQQNPCYFLHWHVALKIAYPCPNVFCQAKLASEEHAFIRPLLNCDFLRRSTAL